MIAAGYIGALLVAGAFLAIGAALSAATKNQVIAFVLGVAVCFLFAVASYPLVTDFLSRNAPVLADVARRISVVERFQGFTRGVIVVARPDLLRLLHRVLAVPERRHRRASEGGLRCAAPGSPSSPSSPSPPS